VAEVHNIRILIFGRNDIRCKTSRLYKVPEQTAASIFKTISKRVSVHNSFLPAPLGWSFKQIIQPWMCQGVGLYLAEDIAPMKKTMAMDMEINCKIPLHVL
jgi:hypothetical protein